MFIDSNRKWDDHINNMIPKISVLRSLRNIVLTDTVIQIYNAIVQPHLDYASQTSKKQMMGRILFSQPEG